MVLYVVIICLSMNLNYWWMIWGFMEILNWMFLLFLKNSSSMLTFMIWQSMSSLILIYSFLIFKNNLMMNISLLFKMSMPPFHIWFWNLLKNMNWKSFLIFLFSNKYLPILILMTNFNYYCWYWFMIFPLISILMFWYLSNFKILIWTIILSDSIWMFFSSLNYSILILYLMINCILMLMMLMYHMNTFKILNVLILIYMMGMPPMSMFMIKFLIIKEISIIKNLFFFLMLCFLYMLMWFWIFIFLNINNFQKMKMNGMYTYILINKIWFFY